MTQELLIEAHHNNKGDSWMLSVWVFVGFIAVLLGERLFP